MPEAAQALVRLIRGMRNNGRRIRFIGVTNTLLSDSDALLIASALCSLNKLGPDEEPETLEMLRMGFNSATRRALIAAAKCAGINLLLSHPNGPALRGFGLYP